MFHLRLKAKLVLAITSMVVVVVAVLSSLYLSQILRQSVDQANERAEFAALEIFHSAREALESDLAGSKIDFNDPKQLNPTIAGILRTDPGVNSLLQSIVGYSPTIYDVAITDSESRVILHSDSNKIGETLPQRDDFAVVHHGSFRRQLRIVYGAPEVYDARLPLRRDGVPFATIRVGISTVFLKSSLQPRLNRAFALSGISILFSLILSAFLSNLALRPLEAISRKLDSMSAATPDAHAANPLTDGPAKRRRTDEFGVVNTKIDRLGKEMRDVKEVFSALKENLDQILSTLQDGVLLFTRDEKAVLVSASAELFLHRPQSELLGLRADQIFTRDTRLGQMVLDAFENHQPIHQTEVPILGVAGREDARVQLSLDFIEENGERIGALVTLRDTESMRRIEGELELSRRMAAVGRLTSGVAHEVKNPINAIVVHLEVLRQKLQGATPDAMRHMDVIASEIRRLDRVVQTLVDFTRPMDLRLVEMDLRRVVEDVITLASPDAEKHGVHVEREITSESLRVKVDSDLVKQALLNIVLNGVQAMEHGGKLTISALRCDGDAEIAVSDEGPGIPSDVREKIFNLYFTTKTGGSGIGLPMSYRVVQMHHGSLDFESWEGRGTRFRLRFPLLDGNSHSSDEVATSASGSKVVN